MSVAVLAYLLAWGVPVPSSQHGAYLAVIERTDDDRLWARVAFQRTPTAGWVPALPRAHSPNELAAAHDALPSTIAWHACRDGRPLGSVVSNPRDYQLFSDLGTHRLGSTPPFVPKSRYDHRFQMFGGARAIRPFVISTLPNVCAIGRTVQQAKPPTVERLVAREMETVRDGRLRGSQAWQVGSWTIVEIDYEVPPNLAAKERILGQLTEEQLRRAKLRKADLSNLLRADTENGTIVFAVGEDIRMRVASAHLVDWVSVDDDDIPDVLLRTSGYNKDGYVLVYDGFTKQVAFEWGYH